LADRRDDSKISISRNKVNVGDDVQFDCDSMSYHVTGAHPTIWIFNHSRFLGARYYQDYESIILKAVQLQDAGSYSCFGVRQDRKKRLLHFTASISLTVYGMLVSIICL